MIRQEVTPLLQLSNNPEILARFERLHAKLQRRLG